MGGHAADPAIPGTASRAAAPRWQILVGSLAPVPEALSDLGVPRVVALVEAGAGGAGLLVHHEGSQRVLPAGLAVVAEVVQDVLHVVRELDAGHPDREAELLVACAGALQG